MKIINVILLLLCLPSLAFTQISKPIKLKATANAAKPKQVEVPKKQNNTVKILPTRPDSIKPFVIADNGDTINVTDKYNLKQGEWVIKSGGEFGEFVQYETGKYINGKKFGRWRVYEAGALLKEENYYNNCLSGVSKYFEEGKLIAKANYYSSKKISDKDTVLVKNPVTGTEKMVVIATEGTSYRDGEWQYYYLSGKLKRAEWYVLDELVDAKDFAEVAIDSTQMQSFKKTPITNNGYQQFDQNNQSHTRFTKFHFIKPPLNGAAIKLR